MSLFQVSNTVAFRAKWEGENFSNSLFNVVDIFRIGADVSWLMGNQIGPSLLSFQLLWPKINQAIYIRDQRVGLHQFMTQFQWFCY